MPAHGSGSLFPLPAFRAAWLPAFWFVMFACAVFFQPAWLYARSITDQHIEIQHAGVAISIHYPQIGIRSIDDDVRQWARTSADQFVSVYGGDAPGSARVPYQLNISYEVIQPPRCLLSIVWTIAWYTEGAHGKLYMLSHNYDAKTGQLVSLLDIFDNLPVALQNISAFSHDVLSRRLEDMQVEDMLREGLLPDADNFSSFALTPDGMRFYFSPFQVAPWSAGPQQVDVPLKVLLPAKPDLRLWGK